MKPDFCNKLVLALQAQRVKSDIELAPIVQDEFDTPYYIRSKANDIYGTREDIGVPEVI